MNDRLSALDAWFLYVESPRTPMHVGSLSWFEGDPLRDLLGRVRIEDLQALVHSRLAAVPRFRQRVVAPPLRLGLPRWTDHESFDIRHHVRLATLPSPGSPAQLRAFAAQLHMELLDRSRPLWEIWFVDGLADGRVAVVEKMHHAMVDGVSGVDVATATMDLSPETPPMEASTWLAGPPPSVLSMVGDAVVGAAVRPAASAAKVLRHPVDALRSARRVGRGLGAMSGSGVRAPRCSLNGPIGDDRVFEIASLSLPEAKAVGRALGTKANDVLLAAVAGGLRRLFMERGEDVDGLRPHVLVPVSLRAGGDGIGLGNRVSSMIVPLPVDVADGWARLQAVVTATSRMRAAGQPDATAALLGAFDQAPPLVWAPITAVLHRQPFVNLVVTNVPGPPVPLYMAGARLLETAPIVPLAGNLDVSVGILSYQDQIRVGLFADGAACPDVAVLAEGIEKSFAELAAHRREAA